MMETRLIELAIPLTRPFGTAAGTIDQRRTVLVGLTDHGTTGWGEAAPYPGMTTDTIEGVWASLSGETSALTPSAAAALEGAEADLAARLSSGPLWQTLGGTARPLMTSVAIGIDDDPIDRIKATGAAAAKLKIRPGDDLRRVDRLRERYPELTIGVDTNGSYSWDGRDALLQLDRLDVAYIEQPFPAADLRSHAGLRQEMLADVALDEPIDSVRAAIVAIEAGAADVLVVKPGRIGLGACRVIHDLALAAGLRVKASGLLETAIGRAHTLAIATLPGAVHSDVAFDSWFFASATGSPRLAVVDGSITASTEPGIGVSPDLDALAPHVIRDITIG